jgi:antirestriction protein ArdC
MNLEQAKQLSENALNHLMTALEAGQSEALKNYLAVMSRFHSYSWGNCLMIHSQRPDSTRVAGFRAWLNLKRFVRKGEKGIVILAPMVGRIKTNQELSEDSQTRLFGFRAAHVFDVSQTEGEPLPKFATVQGDPGDLIYRLTEFVAGQQIALDYSDRIKPAHGMSEGGKITLLPHLEPAEHLSVLVHEVAHEMLHKGERRLSTSHAVRETEAEAVAFVVCDAIGLNTNSASSDYIQLHSGDRATLTESLALIQQTASQILMVLNQESAIICA